MSERSGFALAELLAIMQRLRGADGCPWDRQQSFESIAPHTLEEAYEVVDAIERGDMAHLKEELGDLLFQVVFHAQMAREAGHFDFDAVAAALCDKLVRRHPQVFDGEASATQGPALGTAARIDVIPRGSAVESVDGPSVDGPGESSANAPARLSAAQQSVAWEDIKARERGAGVAMSALAGVPLALPALLRASKLSQRAARVGFDFPHASATADKVAEELAEVREAVQAPGAGPSSHIVEELGDLLFAAANLARKLGVDSEAALRAANLKFERRFHGMERLAAERGVRFESLGLDAQEALWHAVKRGE